ncbi:integration host factor, actinobacterial type [Streptomyces osmaniensis]|uniref:integration host factor, actinobacterial type n=1 Tax=Streptomyces osmaniensis TaxID=593134 RepID=UPI0031FD38E1
MPPLSPEQRRAALEKAAAARKERAEGRDALKHGKLFLAEVLDSGSDAIRKMPVRTLLASLPDIGKVRTQKLLEEIEIADSRRIQGLGIQQCERVFEQFARKR